ncbi:protein-tyrosine-phosphatase [Rhodopirellula sp. SWK7]|nr:protein-tyrosine-phosphatase [Rhodopirellula sp. SWK7]
MYLLSLNVPRGMVAFAVCLGVVFLGVTCQTSVADDANGSRLGVSLLNSQPLVREPIRAFVGETDWRRVKESLSPERREVVDELTKVVETRLHESRPVMLTFICTHNSRRSQFAQVWAQTAAAHFGLTRDDVVCFSGGTEATACNPRTIASLRRAGFVVSRDEDARPETGENVFYDLSFSDSHPPVMCFSKVYDEAHNPKSKYIAVMCCDHADENCPVVRGATDRVAMLYVDPKASDGTEKETATYDERSLQIAKEMWVVMGALAERMKTQ